MPRRLALAVACALAGVLVGCGADGAAPTAARPVATTSASRPAQAAVVKTLVAAGDIACGPNERPSVIACHQGQTAALLDQLRPDVVAPLGDLQYPSGRLADFRRFFGPTWGRWRARMRPVVGNHEYELPNARGYFDYLGARAGPRGRGWYSYDLGAWHVVALNANCTKVGCAAGSAQERWLRADLARRSRRCLLAYWHQPRFSSGRHGNSTRVIPLWRDLQRAGAELVLSGHDHSYERFAPQTASGRRDPRRGIVQFVVGTGGENHYPVFRGRPNSLVHNFLTFGVLELTLRPGSYSWRFVPEAGSTFTDAGSARCH
jgi:3',5'-cyclic AMP phosphodiesterase CpdA